jgi:hypothetical protein
VMPDLAAHELRMPAELKEALKEDRLLKKYFDNLSPWIQRALVALIIRNLRTSAGAAPCNSPSAFCKQWTLSRTCLQCCA